MADLRDSFDVNQTTGAAPDIVDAASAAGMGSLRRGFQSGRLASQANELGAEEATLRANGQNVAADALRQNIGGIQRRQGIFAPEVGRVEDIHGVGDAAAWLGGAVGQGAASMVEPVAAATSIGGAGRLIGAIPTGPTRAIGALSNFAAPAAAFGINQRQLKGEFYNDAVRDPELMRRTTPQTLNTTAEQYGIGAGLLDTAFPAVVGRQLAGAGLRKGIHSLPAPARIGLELAGEGATEAAQTAGSHYVQGQLNPERDTSGDRSELINAFAGGAAGAGPFATAGVMADSGFRRVGDTAERIGTKAGEAFDLAKGAATPITEAAAAKGRGWIGAGKRSLGEVLDLARNEDGKVDPVGAARDVADRLRVSREDQSVLRQEMPENILNSTDPAEQDAWIQENDTRRADLVAQRLADMEANDPVAGQLLDQISSEQDPQAQQRLIDQGADHVLANNEMEQLVSRAEKAAGAVGSAAATAGRAALKFGKAVFDSAKAGATKKNAQTNESLEDFEARMNTAADMAETAARQNVGTGRFARAPVPQLVRQTALKISTLAPNWKEKGMAPGAALAVSNMADTLRVGMGQAAGSTLAEMQAVAPKETHPLFEYLRKQVETGNTPEGRRAREEMRRGAANEIMSFMPDKRRREILDNEAAGGDRARFDRMWLLDQIENVADGHESPQVRRALEREFGAEAFGKMLEAVNGVAQEKALKAETVNDRGQQGEATVNDDGEYVPETQAEDFDTQQADKAVVKGAGPKTYGFARTTTIRGSNERRDPFSPLSKMSDKDRTAFEDENRQRVAAGEEPLAGTPVKRPALFKADDALSTDPSPGSALRKKIADMEKALGVTDENANHAVEAKSARDVMKELGYQPAKVLSLFRDYLRQDAAAQGVSLSERQKLNTQANTVNKAVLDAMEQGGDAKRFRLTPKLRRTVTKAAEDYFNERFVVVGEQLSNRDPSQMAVTELIDLGRAGERAVDATRDDAAARADANLLTFQSDVLPRKAQAGQEKKREIHINAGSLVGWVRKQRALSETGGDREASRSNAAKDEAFLTDLMEGISVVLGSGFVDNAMPTMTNAKGKVESFADGVPPNLKLATKTYGAMEFAKQKRQEARGRIDDPEVSDPEAVAAEQDRDYFTADPLEGTQAEPNVSRAPGSQLTQDEEAALAKLKTPAERRAFLDELGLRQSGERFSDARASDAKSSGEATTPLDFFPRDPKVNGQPDEFADQQFRSKTTGADTSAVPGPESKMTAQREATPRGEALLAQLKGDFPAGLAALQARLRSAARPAFSADKNAAVGGSHYIYPAAHALNADRIASLDLSPAEASQIVQARSEAARVILGATDLSAAQKVALTRAMAPAASADRITLASYQRVLEKASQAPAAAPAPAARARSAPITDAAYDKALATESYADVLRSDADIPALRSYVERRYKELDRKPYDDLTAQERRVLQVAEDLMSPTADWNSFKQDFGPSDLAAPEVAAQAPKSQELPSGAAETQALRNAQDARDGNSATATDADMAAARDYVAKVLGPKIKVEFKDITGYSGEWIEPDQVIRISTTAAAGVMQTAYHEALHGFFSAHVKGDPRVLEVMKTLAENQGVLNRVHALLHRYPAAQAQLRNGEERLAYIYQFWAAGALDLGPSKGRSWLQKVSKFFRRVLGTVQDSERAVELFEAFHRGALAKPSAAGQVIQSIMQQGTMTLRARRKLDGLLQATAAAVVPSESILLRSASPRAQLLARELFSNPGDADAAKYGEGYLNARRSEAMRYKNLFAQAIDGLSDRDLKDVSKYLQSAAELGDIPYAPHRAAVKSIRAALDRFYDYMKQHGVDVGYIEKYFPVIWDTNRLVENKADFINMLTSNYAATLDNGIASSKQKGLSRDDVAERIWRSLIDKQGGDNKIDPDREDGVLVPFFESGEARVLNWIAPEHREPFLEKNLIGQMTRYFQQGARAAEYTSRFGANGEQLDGALREIHNELVVESKAMARRNEFGGSEDARAKWVQRQVRDVHHAVGAIEGSLGKDISPTLRRFNSYMTVYQNVRLLPLSLFSSFVDPLAIVARGGEMKEAYEAFLGGMRDVFRTWGNAFRDEPKAKQRSEWDALAEAVGATDSDIFSHFVADEYASGYLSPLAKKINDKMFVLNGMEAWNRSMRVAATKAAVNFIEKHKALPDPTHSARWLEELGLAPKDIALDADGRLITSRHVLAQAKGISLEQATEDIKAVHFAINRWVEGAVLTPNAAQRPSWSSDPRFSVFFHLKQFAYSFHQTVLKRAVKELEYGNLAPMGVFAWYIPTMIASDIVKGLMTGGGHLPAYMKAYDAGDWVMHGAQRAGLLGVGTIATDAGSDIFSLAGPGVEQAIDALRDPLEKSTIKALPLHGIYQQALK